MPACPAHSSPEPILTKRCTRTPRGPLDTPSMGSEPGKARRPTKGDREEMPHMSDSNYHKGVPLSLSPPTCLCTCVLFLLINTWLLHYFLSLCKNSFLQSWQARAFSLDTGPKRSNGWDSALSLRWPNWSLWHGPEILFWAAAGQGKQRIIQSMMIGLIFKEVYYKHNLRWG